MGLFFKKEDEDENFFALIEQENEEYEKNKPQYAVPTHALTADEVLSSDKPANPPRKSDKSPLQSLKKRMQQDKKTPEKDKKTDDNTDTADIDEKHTILDRVRAYTTDEDGNDVSEKSDPIYELESVAEIIRRKNDDFLQKLSSKFDVSIDNLDKLSATKSEETVAAEEEKTEEEPQISKPVSDEKEVKKTAARENVPEPTEAFEKMVSDAASRDPSQFIFEELFPGTPPLTHTELSGELPDISDIDNRVSEKEDETKLSNTATIKFTPIKSASGETSHISVSSTTRPIDITGELAAVSPETSDEPVETQLEENEFDSYTPDCEYKAPTDAKKIIRNLSLKKRSAFLRAVFTGFCCIVLALFMIPPLSLAFVAHTTVCATICAIVLLAATVANFDALLSLKDLFSRKCKSDVLSVLQALGALSLGAVAIFKTEDVIEMLLLSALILFARSLSAFWNVSYMLSNLKQITGSSVKNAITLIDDRATSFAMAKNAIEGDVLIAAGKKTDFVSDYMKYSTYGTSLSGKVPIVFFGALLLSVAIGFAAGYYFNDMISGFHCAASILCITAGPALFFIDTLPLFTAASKLNRKGSMIAGKAGAKTIELANSAVLSSSDIFPDGMVTLHSMKVLSDNNIDTTIMRAASLTEALGSTLAPIFKRIAGTNASYTMPDSDTVKYEERMGISGWVDNELLFIGNRTLMEAHGIDVPNVEVDRAILRRGYFPVYLASSGKACALIVIQYSVNPNVALELKRIANLGITLLVNNCDPNISEPMICDYIGLYEDSVKLMTNAGVHMYNATVTKADRVSAPATYRGSAINFISVLNCASRIKRSTMILTVCYILTACLGAVLFAYTTFTGQSVAPHGSTVLIYNLIATALSTIFFLTQKP